jgi:CDP-2,3-bis-(O-geranylgeranyl)-sn-glycerol synthase
VPENQIHFLLLIILANAAPVILAVLLKDKLAVPLDFGCKLPDRRPVFGESKTWRGIVGAIVVTAAVAAAFGYGATAGAQIAAYAHIGDLFSSFIKRRLGMAPSSMAPLLDQVPESLFPAVMMRQVFSLDVQSIIVLVSSFIVLELLLSWIFFRLGIRKRPY